MTPVKLGPGNPVVLLRPQIGELYRCSLPSNGQDWEAAKKIRLWQDKQ